MNVPESACAGVCSKQKVIAAVPLLSCVLLSVIVKLTSSLLLKVVEC